MEEMCHRAAVAFYNKKDEPIPPFETCKKAELEAALALPKQVFYGQEAYPTLERKAAVLYYTINKGHFFQNGNKRIATVTLLVFLIINGYDLDVTDDELTNKAIEVANSKPIEKPIAVMLDLLTDWIRFRLKEEKPT